MNYDNAIAVIGLSARVPGSSDLAQFWQNLSAGNTAFRTISDEALHKQGLHEKFLAQDNYVKVGVGLADIDKFDASFFDIPAREACFLDPQQRILLEGCWEALESAGYATEQASRSVGVFAGASMNSYWMRNLGCQPEHVSSNTGFQGLLGNEKDYLATRVAYKLNLQGPAVTVQTACSTSLVAVHMACQNILLGECEMALAGGVSVKVPQDAGYFYQDGMPFSKDGQCLVFDKDSSGTIFGSGMGVVLLKSYLQAVEDNDNILAVILGSAFNNDGNRKVGFTAPSHAGQVAAINRALAVADVDASSISYIETHGTGTNLGDPIEFQGIQQVYGAGNTPCYVGALKANIGHLETAAGIVGLIKTVLMLQHKQIPPLANFHQLNPLIEAQGTRFQFNTMPQAWQSATLRRAGISSFGMGGTNSHIILEEAPSQTNTQAVNEDPHREIMTLSAKSAGALEQMTANLLTWLEANQDTSIHHVIASLQLHRQAFSHRRALLAHSVEQAIDVLKNHPEAQLTMSSPVREELVYLFPGAGAQYVNMGRDLYRTYPTYAEAIERCLTRFEQLLQLPLKQYFDAPEEQVDAFMMAMQTPSLMFPLTFSFQYALTQLLAEWQLTPSSCLGHSHGEYIIAHLAGVMDFDTVTWLVAKRAELMMKLPPGAMLVVPHSAEQVAAVVAEIQLSVGACNSHKNTVLSGTKSAIDTAKELLIAQLGGDIKTLHVDAGLHSHLVDEIYDEFLTIVQQCQLHAPKMKWVSSISGQWVTDAVTQGKYWADHMRNTVNFIGASATLVKAYPNAVFLDLGPNRIVSELIRENHPDKKLSVVAFARSHRQEVTDITILQEALSKLWLYGYRLDWSVMSADTVKPLDLPTYAFDRRSYWIEPNRNPDDALRFESLSFSSDATRNESDPAQGNRPNLMTPFVAPLTATEQDIAHIWRQFFGIEPLGIFDNFIELGGTSLLATEVVAEISRVMKCKITLSGFLTAGNIQKTAELVQQWHEANDMQLKLEILALLEQEPA